MTSAGLGDLWTIQKILAWTSAYFSDKGLDSPRLDAELLIAHALDFDRTRLYMELNKPLQEVERTAIRSLVRRRAQREPVAQIIGWRGFWKHEFKVDSRVLTPRPDTERLVERAIEVMVNTDGARIVDVGTGSGCIAISLALDLPHCEVLAVDRCSDALAVAKANGERLAMGRVEWLQGDLLSPVHSPINLVVSNPPYIPSNDIDNLMPEVARFEPRSALDGGPDGLEVIDRLVGQAERVLAPGGYLMLEIGHDQGQHMLAMLDSYSGFKNCRLIKDYGGRDRVVEAVYEP